MDAEHNQLLATLAQDYYLSKMAISDISKSTTSAAISS